MVVILLNFTIRNIEPEIIEPEIQNYYNEIMEGVIPQWKTVNKYINKLTDQQIDNFYSVIKNEKNSFKIE